ncbi:MAG: DUF6679 family protein [Cyanobacteria bacterium P01_H01_bin.15]
MLSRKLYQFYTEGREIGIFLRDQQRWIDNAKIVALEGDLVTIRYEMEEEEEISSWEEIVRLESVGAVTHQLSSVSKVSTELAISDDCPEAEQIHNPTSDSNQD